MKLVIVGVGEVGETLVKELSKEKHDIVVVDNDAQTIERCINKYDVNGIVGGGCEREVLLQANTDTADFFIACSCYDEVNILSCVLAKKLGAKHTVARVRDPEYFKEIDNISASLGIDMAFNPEYRTAIEVAQLLKYPSALKVESFSNGKSNLVEFAVMENNPLSGKSLKEISEELGANVIFAMVKRDEKTFIPKGDFVINVGDKITVIGSEKGILDFCKKIKIFKPSAKSVFIIGGGKTSYYLAKQLSETGIDVKIVEKDEKRAEELGQELPLASILQGDASDHYLLEEEGLYSVDACVTMSGLDELNVIISLYAAKKKVPQIITTLEGTEITTLVEDLGLDTIINTSQIIANQIIRFIRSTQSENGHGVIGLYKLSDTVEALEFSVNEQFKYAGIPLKDLNIRKDVILGGIVRNDEFVLTGGSTCMQPLDKVLVVTTHKQITDLEEIIK